MSRIAENTSHSDTSQADSVLVFGGTGFIGYHIVQALLKKGRRVSVLTRNPEKHQGLFPDSVAYVQGDLDSLSVEQLIPMLHPFNKIIFAAGVDERIEPTGDAWEFFKKANVESCKKVFTAAQHSNVDHAVLLSSIFLYVHHQNPNLKLEERHPYIRSRIEQHRISKALAENHFILTTLEVPWVFGIAPHISSQWKTLINYVRSATPLMVCRGGMNVVAVESVAEAAVASLYCPQKTSEFVVGDLNLTYQQFIQLLCGCVERHDQQILIVNDRLFQDLMQTGALFKRLFKIPSGLDIQYLPELLMQDLFLDNTNSKKILGYSTGKAKQAIYQTVNSLPENSYVKAWRKLINLFH